MILETIGYGVQSTIGLVQKYMPFKVKSHPTFTLPQVVERLPPTSQEEIDEYLSELQSASIRWVEMSPDDRAELFLSCIPHILKASYPATEQLIKIKGQYESGKADERLSWVLCVQLMMGLAKALKANGQLQPNKIFENENGQLIADVYPQGPDHIFNNGFRSSLYIQKGKPASQGRLYKEKSCGQTSQGGVALVLGAGNQWFLSIVDMLHKMVFEDQVVILKMNPILETIGPYILQALKPIHDLGFFKIVYGGAEEGKYLSTHPSIKSIHLTGSSATYDAIVWGKDVEKKGKPQVTVPFTAELGNVTPYIIVPGKWSEDDMRYHIRNSLIPGKVSNCGHNCLALEVIVTSKKWDQRERFLEIFREEMNKMLQRKPWYPGSVDKYMQFLGRFPNSEKLGKKLNETDDVLPYLAAFNLTPQEAWLDQEKFCCVLQEVTLDDCPSPPEFMKKAADFVNSKCFGSLVCSIFIPPKTEFQFSKQFELMIDELKYGSIVVNSFSAFGYAVEAGVWGAYPGNKQQNIGSGSGFVRNHMMFDFPEKQVVRCDFRLPYTIMSAQNSNLDKWSEAVVELMHKPSLYSMTNVFYQLFRMQL